MRQPLIALKYLAEALRVRRCHAEPVLHPATVGEHSCGVALLCLLLTEGQASGPLLRAALTHDLGERRWGDMPGNVKHELQLDAQFDELERRTLADLELPLPPPLTGAEARTLALADKLDLLLHCCLERAQGNQLVRTMWGNCFAALQRYQPFSAAEAELVNTTYQLWRHYDE